MGARFRYDPDTDRMVNVDTGEPMVDPASPFVPVTPMHVPDIAPYLSPVTGEYIAGRRAKRADLEKHNCIDAGDLPSPTGGKFKSKRMVEKYNLPRHLLREDAK